MRYIFYRITFQSTPSAWRETIVLLVSRFINLHFNPLPPHGGRRPNSSRRSIIFDISIHSLRMEGDNIRPLIPTALQSISIHSLRMEGDAKKGGTVIGWIDISIHSLRMEGDSDKSIWIYLSEEFQSTPSAWRETLLLLFPVLVSVFQSTPSAWRETIAKCAAVCYDSISIHSLRMEGDAFSVISQRYVSMDFNPLPPHGGRPLD